MWTHNHMDMHNQSGYDPNRPMETGHLFRLALDKDMARMDLGEEEAGDCLASLLSGRGDVEALHNAEEALRVASLQESLVAAATYNTEWVNMSLNQDPAQRRVEKRAASPLGASDNGNKKQSFDKANGNAEKCQKYRANKKVKLPRRRRRSYQVGLTCTPTFPCAANGLPEADGRRPPGHRGESIDLG